MNIKNWFTWLTPKPKLNDFILTKKYKIRNIEKGGLILRVENIQGETLKCSKGRFYLDFENKKSWKPNGYIGISLNNVERILKTSQAEKMLGENILKVR